MDWLNDRDRRRLSAGTLAFLIATLSLGLALRGQLAGWGFVGGNWDLRRAHSHLGFYGLLLPLAWLALGEAKGRVPRGRELDFYFAMSAVSGVGFLLQGYGLVSIAASTGILLVWLRYAWRNRIATSFLKPGWLATSAPAIGLSTLLIFCVAITSRREPMLASQISRVFLSLLLFGAVMPAALRNLGGAAPYPGPWLAATLLGSVSLTGLDRRPVFSLGLLWLGGSILSRVFRQFPSLSAEWRRVSLHWLLLSAGLLATGLGLLPHTHSVAIAGVHYLILGPLLLSFAQAHAGRIRVSPVLGAIYELSVLAMVSCIALQDLNGAPVLSLQKGAALAGAGVLISVAWTCARALFARGASVQSGAESDASGD